MLIDLSAMDHSWRTKFLTLIVLTISAVLFLFVFELFFTIPPCFTVRQLSASFNILLDAFRSDIRGIDDVSKVRFKVRLAAGMS